MQHQNAGAAARQHRARYSNLNLHQRGGLGEASDANANLFQAYAEARGCFALPTLAASNANCEQLPASVHDPPICGRATVIPNRAGVTWLV